MRRRRIAKWATIIGGTAIALGAAVVAQLADAPLYLLLTFIWAFPVGMALTHWPGEDDT